jgi:glutamyl-tRNA reductase
MVAAGLDSVIWGEAQILGQIRDALTYPATQEVAGGTLKRLFQSALAAGKRVRSETAIGCGSASVAGTALRLLESDVRNFANCSALVLGAGETGTLVARLLRKAGVSRLMIANRTLSRAQAVAAEVGGEAWALEALPQLIAEADVIVGTVSGRQDLVTRAMVLQAGAGRRRYIVDLAHPHNFAADFAGLPDLKMLDLAEVFERTEAARAARAGQVPLANAIVDAEVENFGHWVRGRETAPVLQAVREQVLALARAEAERRGQGRSDAERSELLQLARSIARAMLHSPTVAIRQADPRSAEGQSFLRAAASLFGAAASRDTGSRTIL